MLQFRFDALSDTGRVRDHNEDAGFAGPYLLCVADGVGGAAAGEVAAATASYVVSARALAHPGRDPLRVLQTAVTDAHEQLVGGVVADPARASMATTLTAILTDGIRFGLAHLGDSRAYLFRDGGLTQVSHDHTMVQAMVDAGRLTAAEAAASPYRHVVLQALDAQAEPTPDLLWLDLRAGDRLLLCSDGLTDVVPDHQLAAILTDPSRSATSARLVRTALEAGSRDNVTCIVADVVDAAPIVGNGQVIGAGADLTNVVDPVGVRPLRTA